MRIELSNHAERFGANLFYNVQKVYELDGGIEQDAEFASPFHVIQQISMEKLQEVNNKMAIVIPVKNERLRLLEGVLCGIPHHCLPIIVSNSLREPVDRFLMECRMIDTFCRYAKKKYVAIHQRSPELAEILRQGGYSYLLDESDGLVRNGKAEGMLAGIILAHMIGKCTVGFIDSDNYFPGAVFEYARLFAAGMVQAQTPYTMVRIHWHSKPKIRRSALFFAKWGRVSRITNHHLNQLLSQYTGFETETIRTGNAGEHAMSMDLALRLDYSAGFSVETYHFVSLLEKFGGIEPSPFPEVMRAGVEIFQMESRNPHLHELAKGENHLKEMIEGSLSVLYHSEITPEILKKDLLKDLFRLKIIEKNQPPVRPIRYPALIEMDFEQAKKVIDWEKHGNFKPV